MTIIPLAIINCSVVELLLQVIALVYVCYGEQHCITLPKLLSIGINVIPPQLLQMTTMVMLVPNLNLSMLLSQYAETMIEILQTPLSCYGILLYVKEHLAIYYSLLKLSLRFFYGRHYIEWDSPTALHVTRMNVMRKADNEHSPAMIEVMNRTKYAFGYGPLARKIQENISPIIVERVRPTTDISSQEPERKKFPYNLTLRLKFLLSVVAVSWKRLPGECACLVAAP
jgi:hypothetical protein